MRLNRIQKAQLASENSESMLSFDYMKIGHGWSDLEPRVVRMPVLRPNHEGRMILTAEDLGRGEPRSFRLERMYHVNLI